MGIEILHHQARRADDAEHAQAFFGKTGQQRGIGGKPGLKRGVAGQVLKRKRRDIGHGVHPAEEQDETHRQDFVLAKQAAFDIDGQEMGDQVVAGVVAAPRDQVGENGENRVRRVGDGVVAARLEERVGNAAELVQPVERQAHQIHEHRHRKPRRDIAHEIARTATGHIGDDFARAGAHLTLHPGDRARRKPGHQHVAIGQVFGRIEAERDEERRVFDARDLHFARREHRRILDHVGDQIVPLDDPVSAVARGPENVRRSAQRGGIAALNIIADARIGINVECKHLIGADMRGDGGGGRSGRVGHGIVLSLAGQRASAASRMS